jgi:hypothetical protein
MALPLMVEFVLSKVTPKETIRLVKSRATQCLDSTGNDGSIENGITFSALQE